MVEEEGRRHQCGLSFWRRHWLNWKDRMPLQEEMYGSPTPLVFIFPLFNSFLPSFLRSLSYRSFLFSAVRTYIRHLPLEEGSARYPCNERH